MTRPSPLELVHSISFLQSLTSKSVLIAVQHLYRPAQNSVTPDNARAVLATAVLFDGMPELAQHAYTVLRDSITAESAIDLAHWASESTRPSHEQSVNGSGSSAGGDRKYGEWSSRIQADV
jgi:hypothetical protein